jgi:hypothetical protein
LGVFAAVFALSAFFSSANLAIAAEPAPSLAAADKEPAPSGKIDLNALKEQIRRLGEVFRKAMDEAARSVESRPRNASPRGGGISGVAPNVRRGDLRAVYGPDGPTLRSVKALLQYRLVLSGNKRLTAGRVFERDKRIIAEILTIKEKALVARYMVNKTTGEWVPER